MPRIHPTTWSSVNLGKRRGGGKSSRKKLSCSLGTLFFCLVSAFLVTALLLLHLHSSFDAGEGVGSLAPLSPSNRDRGGGSGSENGGGERKPTRHRPEAIKRLTPEKITAYDALWNVVGKDSTAAGSEKGGLGDASTVDGAKDDGKRPVKIAYAISLIRCGDFQSTSSGLLDAAAVLRHSVHQTSVRNPGSASRYDYEMYAIVHPDAAPCSSGLEDLGFRILRRDPPVKIEEIRGEFLRKNVHKEWCCGADEFVKLHAYTIENHPVVVHTDVDFLFLRPMDELFDAMLASDRSAEGRSARKLIDVEYPGKSMPKIIDAFITRDYHQVIPGRKAAVQAGFMVVRPNKKVFDEYVEVIREGNFVEGFSRENGWGGKGYGGVVGAMAMQGLPAYYYDVVRPDTSVELNGCRYNHMGADVLYRDIPSYFPNKYPDKVGKCRRDVDGCEDCQLTKVSVIKNAHYTNCRKPWNCAGTGEDEGGKQSGRKGQCIDTNTANYEHCMKVVRKWHEVRNDLEQKLFASTGDESVLNGQGGDYMTDVFMGHCDKDGPGGYRPISASKERLLEAKDKVWLEGRKVPRFETAPWWRHRHQTS